MFTISVLISSPKPGREKDHDLTKVLVARVESVVGRNINVGGLLPLRSAIEGEFPLQEEQKFMDFQSVIAENASIHDPEVPFFRQSDSREVGFLVHKCSENSTPEGEGWEEALVESDQFEEEGEKVKGLEYSEVEGEREGDLELNLGLFSG